MGRRGVKSSAPGGYGTISAKGYRRVRCPREKRLRMEHVLVWEDSHGSIPSGMQIHHKDGDKLNNAIENLEMLDALTHKRLHGGCEIRDGEWWKPCRKCGEMKMVASGYYRQKVGISPWCKSCCIANAVKNKKKRRELARTE